MFPPSQLTDEEVRKLTGVEGKKLDLDAEFVVRPERGREEKKGEKRKRERRKGKKEKKKEEMKKGKKGRDREKLAGMHTIWS